MRRFDLLDEYTTVCVPSRPRRLPTELGQVRCQDIFNDQRVGLLTRLLEGTSYGSAQQGVN